MENGRLDHKNMRKVHYTTAADGDSNGVDDFQAANDGPIAVTAAENLLTAAANARGTKHGPFTMSADDIQPTAAANSRGTKHGPFTMSAEDIQPSAAANDRGTKHGPFTMSAEDIQPSAAANTRGTKHGPFTMSAEDIQPTAAVNARGTKHGPFTMSAEDIQPTAAVNTRGTKHGPFTMSAEDIEPTAAVNDLEVAQTNDAPVTMPTEEIHLTAASMIPETNDEKQTKELYSSSFPVAEQEHLLTSNQQSANNHGEEGYSSVTDANVNALYHDNVSDYHENSTHIDTTQSHRAVDGGTTAVYKRRWYILCILSLCVTLQNAVWATWGPIAESAMVVYGWDTTMIFIIINCGNIGVLLPVLFTGHMISSYGLRLSMVVCALFLTIGTGLRAIPSATAGTILIGAGQFCNGLAGSITQVIPAALSEAWFPVNERATATAVGVISNSVGSIVAFMLGPHIVNEPSSIQGECSNTSFVYTNTSFPDIMNATNVTRNICNDTKQNEFHTISHQIWILTMIEFGAGIILLILTLAYFPAKPPKPPSRSANEERVNFTQGLCTVIKQPLIVLAAMSCAVPWAVFGNWMGLVNVNLHEIGISQNQAGWFGVYASIAGVVGGIVIGRIADQFQRRLKLFVMVVFILALLDSIWITCMRNDYIPRSIILFAVSISILGVMLNAALPLCYEMTCECGYPIHEGIIGTFISLEINAAAVIFLLLKFIPNIGVTWMNWVLVGVLFMSIVCLALLKEKYHRADVDGKKSS